MANTVKYDERQYVSFFTEKAMHLAVKENYEYVSDFYNSAIAQKLYNDGRLPKGCERFIDVV